jgi:hypothetical protein
MSDAQAARQVVGPEGARVGAGHGRRDDSVPAEERDQEGERRHEVWRVVEEPLSLGQVLVDEADLFLLEVAKTAVDQLRGP